MVWIRCISGEFLDPQKISSISLVSCHANINEVDIFAVYEGHKFLLHRTTLTALKKMGISKNQEKFQKIISVVRTIHSESKSISYKEIFEMILQSEDSDITERSSH